MHGNNIDLDSKKIVIHLLIETKEKKTFKDKQILQKVGHYRKKDLYSNIT